MKIDLNKIKEYDYSDTSTARELIYMLTEELQKTYKLQDDLIEAITKKVQQWKPKHIKASSDNFARSTA